MEPDSGHRRSIAAAPDTFQTAEFERGSGSQLLEERLRFGLDLRRRAQAPFL